MEFIYLGLVLARANCTDEYFSYLLIREVLADFHFAFEFLGQACKYLSSPFCERHQFLGAVLDFKEVKTVGRGGC